MTGTKTPELSAIVVTPDRLDTVARTLDCLRRQTFRELVEIVMVVPGLAREARDDSAFRGFFGVQWVQVGEMRSTAEARAAGIRAAAAPVIALTEDHSCPEPGWAEALIRAHKAGWAAVGPVMGNANPDSLVSWANLMIDYGEWLAPSPAGIRSHLPGHNSSYKRALLLEYGDALPSLLEAESVLQWDLRGKGGQLYLEPAARTNHLNYSKVTSSVVTRLHVGRLFAATRALGWPAWRRLLYAIGSPLIPFLRLVRTTREMLRPGRATRRTLGALAFVFLFLVSDGAGQMLGYWLGVGDSALRAVDIDFHRDRFMNDRDQMSFQ